MSEWVSHALLELAAVLLPRASVEAPFGAGPEWQKDQEKWHGPLFLTLTPKGTLARPLLLCAEMPGWAPDPTGPPVHVRVPAVGVRRCA